MKEIRINFFWHFDASSLILPSPIVAHRKLEIDCFLSDCRTMDLFGSKVPYHKHSINIGTCCLIEMATKTSFTVGHIQQVEW